MRVNQKTAVIVFGIAVIVFTVAISPAYAAVAWTTQTVDSTLGVGIYNSIALDSQGNPCISYYDGFNYDLKYAHYNGVAWSTSTVDSSGSVGLYTSIIVDAADRPIISYYDGSNYNLKCARWTGTTWNIATVDSASGSGLYTSIAFDSNGYPCISYDGPSNQLRYAKWTGSAWSVQTITAAGQVGVYDALAFDLSGNPAVAYTDLSTHSLKIARYDGANWNIQTVDGAGTGAFISLRFNRCSTGTHPSPGNPAVSYYDFNNYRLKYAYQSGGVWTAEVADAGPGVGSATSLAFNPQNGNPAVSYYDSSNYRLKYAYWDSAWNPQVVDVGGCGSYNSLAIDSSGIPQIAYYALVGASGNLKYAKGASLLVAAPELPLGSALAVGATFFAALGFVAYKRRRRTP